ncbi:MAG: recombinase family protein [Amphritea sp.]
MIIGYARVSSAGQKLGVQLDKLNIAGCEKIFQEKQSGASTNKRIELKTALNHMREGDSFVVTKLDRLARSINDLSTIVAQLEEMGVTLQVLDQNIDTSTSEGRLMLNMLGSFAEFERDIRAERQADGIAKAMKEGKVKFGRPAKLTEAKKAEIRERASDINVSKKALLKEFNISRSTLYRVLDSASV